MPPDANSALSAAATAPAKAPEAPIEDSLIAKPMSKGTRLLLGLYMMALNVLLVYLLIKIWPEKSAQTAAETVALFWNQFHI